MPLSSTPPPFAAYEWMIALRYLRAKRAEGGVSAMTWISFIGITLAVFALIATMAVRSGFRAEFVDTILGANAHVTVYKAATVNADGQMDRGIYEYEAIAEALRKVPGVQRVAPLVKGQVMASNSGRNAGVQVFGITLENLLTLPRIAHPETYSGDINRFQSGIAIGSGVARELGVIVGDRIKLMSPDGVKTAFGISPRVKSYQVEYIFTAGRYDIDRTRVYMPFASAQSYFNSEAAADEFEVMVVTPELVDDLLPALLDAGGDNALVWSWRQASGSFLRALTIEDNVMFIIMSILVLIAAMNIVSGLIMLVKNKGRDIGILRTMGLSQGAVMRIFFICGASTGILGTFFGVLLGVVFTLYIDTVFSAVNYLAGGGVWDPSIRGLYEVPAKLQFGDVVTAILLSLSLSFGATIFPAHRAARLNPVEALRYE
jgi:lipoprotein-releasing system permease protein